MNSFSIGDAWSHAVAFLKTHLQMLVIIVGGGLALSAILQYLSTGGIDQQQQLTAITTAMASGDFGRLANNPNAAMGLGGGIFAIIAGIVQSAAQFAALRLGLAPGEEQTGSAISYGLGAAVTLMLFFIAVVIVAAIAIVVPMVALGTGAAAAGGGTPSGAMIALMVIAGLAFLVLLVWLSVRLSVMQAAMAAARSTNPIYGIKESWRLTRGNALMIFLYFIVLGILALVVMAVMGGIIGVIGAAVGSIGTMILTTVILSIPVGIVGLGITAGIYQTLVPDTRYDIFN